MLMLIQISIFLEKLTPLNGPKMENERFSLFKDRARLRNIEKHEKAVKIVPQSKY
jgi:hypothetical protein